MLFKEFEKFLEKRTIVEVVIIKKLMILSLLLGGMLFSPLGMAQEGSLSRPKSGVSLLKEDLFEKTQAEILSMFRAYSFDERQDKSQLVQLYIEPKLHMELHKTLKFRARGSVSLSTARIQTRFEDPTFNTLNLNELVLSYEPREYLGFEFGALDQNFLNAPMLIAERAFPGVRVNGLWTGEKSALVLSAQYSIPNSVSLESDRIDNEPLPGFLTQGLNWHWEALSWVRLKASVHHFTYKDLPSVVAFQSGRLGNEVIGENSSESFFAYDFDGFSQSFDLSVDYNPRVRHNFKVQLIENLEAPSDRRRSQWTGMGFDFFFSDLVISPEIAYFYAESDSAPALYSAVQLGRNNREGMFYSLKLHFQKLGFVLRANYVQANLIETHPIQNDLNAFEFLVELPSVKF